MQHNWIVQHGRNNNTKKIIGKFETRIHAAVFADCMNERIRESREITGTKSSEILCYVRSVDDIYDELKPSETPYPYRVISGHVIKNINPDISTLVDADDKPIAELRRDHPNFEANVRILKGLV